MVGNAWYQADLVTYYEIHNIIYCIFIIGGESRTVIPYSLWKDIIYYRLIVGGGGRGEAETAKMAQIVPWRGFPGHAIKRPSRSPVNALDRKIGRLEVLISLDGIYSPVIYTPLRAPAFALLME